MKNVTRFFDSMEQMSVPLKIVLCALLAAVATAAEALSQTAAVNNAAVASVVTPNVQATPAVSPAASAAVSADSAKAAIRPVADPTKLWTLITDGDSDRTTEKTKALCVAVIEGKNRAFDQPIVHVTVAGNYYKATVVDPDPGKNEMFILRVDVDEKNCPYRLRISSGEKGTTPAERLEVSDTGLRGLTIEGKVSDELTKTKDGIRLDVESMLKAYLRSCVCACHTLIAAADNADIKRQ